MSKRKEISPMLEEELRIIGALKNLDELLSPYLWKNSSTKNSPGSNKARQEGNDLYIQDKHDEKTHKEILELYTKSVAFAPTNSEALALAYGNRSALLAHLGKHRESIADLDRALNLPLSEILKAKYLCRKVECQAELGMQEAKDTCEETKNILREMCASDELKKNIVIKLVKAIVKLEKGKFQLQEIKPKPKLPNADKFEYQKSIECSNASKALVINRSEKYYRFGRHLIAGRDIAPGEVLYVGIPYVVFPMQGHVYTNCSHCLKFAWDAVPCENCVYAIYCSEMCKSQAYEAYHDIECKIIHRGWKINERMNSARLMSVRLLIMAMKESGSFVKLKQDFEEVDNWKDKRTKGFSNNQTFDNNYISAYSLLTHISQKSTEELTLISKDSAVLLYLIARYTKLFRKYFQYDKKDLMFNENALFVGRLISHYQHLILINAVSVKDTYTASSTDWTWTAPKEENCTGLYLNPFLSLINHSCYPNVTKCETEDRKTVLYSIRPISEGEQIFDCYGPAFFELIKKQRHDLIKRFYFICDCIACKDNWPIFMNMISNGVTFSILTYPEIEATSKAQQICEEILKALKDGNANFDSDTVRDVAYAIILTVKYCKSPNWRLPSLTSILIAVFNELYGYVINIPVTCK